MTTHDDWARLCALLDDDAEMADGVAAALAAGDDAWEALIDGLDDAGALAYLESDDGGVEAADALVELPRVFAAGADLDEVGDVDDLLAALARADELLAPRGLRTVHLAEDDDAYPVVVVPAAAVDEIVALAAGLGHEARGHS